LIFKQWFLFLIQSIIYYFSISINSLYDKTIPDIIEFKLILDMKNNKYFKILIKLQFLIIVLIHSSCSILQPPSIRSYNFKEKGDVCVAATIGVNYEFQAAYSLVKHLYINSGYRHKKEPGRNYSDIIYYNSQNIGLGYYTAINTNSYFQFGGEFFDGAGKFENQIGHSTPEFTVSTLYSKGFAISGLYSNYSERNKYGIMVGIRKGKTWNAVTLIEDIFTVNKYKIGILEHKQYIYSEYCFSVFHRFKNRSALSLNFCLAMNGIIVSLSGTALLSYQITFNTRKKNRVN